MDRDLARRWFGKAAGDGGEFRFSEDEPLCRLWLRRGRVPAVDRVERYDTRTYVRFTDGAVIWRPNDQEEMRLLTTDGTVSMGTTGGTPPSSRETLFTTMREAGMCISQGPNMGPTHSICDWYDFAVYIGTPIHAIAAGRVIFSADVNDVYRPSKITVRT